MLLYRSTCLACMFTISLVILTGNCGSAGAAHEWVSELMSYNYPDYYIGVQDTTSYRAVIKRSAKPNQWMTKFPGLCGDVGTFSFQLRGTNRYLRVRKNKMLYVDSVENEVQYKKDACFYFHSLIFPFHALFANIQYPDHVIRHHTYNLQLDYFNGTSNPGDSIKKDASFQILRPYCIKLQSYNYPHTYFGLNDDAAAFIKTKPALYALTHGLYIPDKKIRTISFRSCDDATKFLHYRPNSLWIYEDDFSYENDADFRKQASFFLRPSKYFKGFSAFESVDHPNHFIRHEWSRLQVDKYVDTDLFRKDASFDGIIVKSP